MYVGRKMQESESSKVAVIVIGRNEGARLVDCLHSISKAYRVVYVDSGSIDGSVSMAKERADLVIQLDAGRPFTAARARNEGAFAAIEAWPELEYLQFIDGDCVLQPTWLYTAMTFLSEHPEIAVACGRRRERYPQRSIYNRLCDLEWNTPVGSAYSCGGDAMIRTRPFLQVNGYQPELIAGEEPEMCARLRAAGWGIWRLDAEMTTHDAAMLRFPQWWRRAVRSGYAELDICLRSLHLHLKASNEKRQVARSAFWGVVYPLFAGALTILFPGYAFAAFGLYIVQIARIAIRRDGFDPISWAYAAFMLLAKFAAIWGMVIYLWRSIRAAPAILIEYKDLRRSP